MGSRRGSTGFTAVRSLRWPLGLAVGPGVFFRHPYLRAVAAVAPKRPNRTRFQSRHQRSARFVCRQLSASQTDGNAPRPRKPGCKRLVPLRTADGRSLPPPRLCCGRNRPGVLRWRHQLDPEQRRSPHPAAMQTIETSVSGRQLQTRNTQFAAHYQIKFLGCFSLLEAIQKMQAICVA